MAELPRFNYGGQAVIEGVMIRGRNFFSLAVRRQDGTIFRQQEPLNNMFNGPIRRVPLLRGVLVLLESLTLGMKALRRSANIAMQEDQGRPGGFTARRVIQCDSRPGYDRREPEA